MFTQYETSPDLSDRSSATGRTRNMTWVWVQKLGDQECPCQVSHSRQMDVSAQQREQTCLSSALFYSGSLWFTWSHLLMKAIFTQSTAANAKLILGQPGGHSRSDALPVIWASGLTSFRIDWFDLFAVQRDSRESSPAP